MFVTLKPEKGRCTLVFRQGNKTVELICDEPALGDVERLAAAGRTLLQKAPSDEPPLSPQSS